MASYPAKSRLIIIPSVLKFITSSARMLYCQSHTVTGPKYMDFGRCNHSLNVQSVLKEGEVGVLGTPHNP